VETLELKEKVRRGQDVVAEADKGWVQFRVWDVVFWTSLGKREEER